MHRAMIYVNPTMPDQIGFAQAAGLPGDVRFDFKLPSQISLFADFALSLAPTLATAVVASASMSNG